MVHNLCGNLKKSIAYLLYGLLALLYILHQATIKFDVFISSWVHGYLDDFLALPLILFSILLLFRMVIFKGKTYTIPYMYIILTWAFFSVYFEVWLPRKNNAFTADPWDMLAYGAGGILFVLMQKPFEKTNVRDQN